MSYHLVPHLPRLVCCWWRITASDTHIDTTFTINCLYTTSIYIYMWDMVLNAMSVGLYGTKRVVISVDGIKLVGI